MDNSQLGSFGVLGLDSSFHTNPRRHVVLMGVLMGN